MKLFIRIGFFAFLVGALGLPIAILIGDTPSEAANWLGFTGFLCLFGLQIWSAIFLKSEPNFARASVIVVTVLAAGLWLYMATHPDSN
jgi:tryptophan-rich sensory protein